MKEVTRKPCNTCGYTKFRKTWDFANDQAPVLECLSCEARRPRKEMPRQKLAMKYINAQIQFSKDMEPINARLDAAIEAGAIKTGWLLVYGTCACYAYTKEVKKPTSWDYKHQQISFADHIAKADKALSEVGY